MKKELIKKITFNKDTKIERILSIFNETAKYTDQKGFGVIIDSKNKCIGVVTDGDIRNYLSKGGNQNKKVSTIMKKDFIFGNKNNSYHILLKLFDNDILHLPILDLNNKLINVINYSELKPKYNNDKKIYRARCPARISFSGGGLDFSKNIIQNKAFLLTSSINKYCYASIKIRNDKKIFIYSNDLNINYKCNNLKSIKFGDKLDLIKSAIIVMAPDFGFEIETFSELDVGTGLGASSSLTIAIVSIFYNILNNNDNDLYKIANLAYKAERQINRLSGGWQDFYAGTFGGFNFIEFDVKDVFVNSLKIKDQIKLELEHNLILFRFGKTRKSNKIQSELKKRINNKQYNEISSEMNKLTVKMKNEFIKGNISEFSKLILKNWEIKKQYNPNVSNKSIETIFKEAKKIGAISYKLLGAGKSGYLLFYIDSKNKNKLINFLKKKKIFFENFNFSDTGLQNWQTQIIK